jgi:hypothetical protein
MSSRSKSDSKPWVGRKNRNRSRKTPPPLRLDHPGQSLQVASACSLLARRNRPAEFELALDDWAEFGLSRFSASRGLDELERAELVSVGRMSGRSPIVTIVDATAAND